MQKVDMIGWVEWVSPGVYYRAPYSAALPAGASELDKKLKGSLMHDDLFASDKTTYLCHYRHRSNYCRLDVDCLLTTVI